MKRNKSLDKKSYPKVGYYWVPASIEGSSPTMSVGVTPIKDKNAKRDITYKVTKDEKTRRFVYSVRTPTTVVQFSTKGSLIKGHEQTYHLGKSLYEDLDFSLYGVAEAPAKKFSEKRDLIRSKSHVIQDSGGFQLATGVEEFLDPLHVAKMHSLYADSGVALDIPTFGTKDQRFLAATAKMQRYNSKVLREHTDKAVKLMNVCHGITLDLRSSYLKEILKGEPLDSLCVGGLRQTAVTSSTSYITPLRFVTHVLLSLFTTSKLYEHYHVLGVASDWQMSLLAIISDVHQKVITSDSATHVLSSKSGLLLQYAGQQTSTSKIGTDLEIFNNTRCSCKACCAVQYEYIYKKFTTLGAFHNLFALQQQGRVYDGLAKAYSRKLDSSKLSDILLRNLKSLGTTAADKADFRKAVNLCLNAKSISDLKSVNESGGSQSVLFGSGQTKDKLEFLMSILRRYESYHKTKFY